MINDDITGLYGLNDDYKRLAETLDDSATYLSKKVGRLVQEAGWSGDAADAFQAAWGVDSAIQAAAAEAMHKTRDIVKVLADQLTEVRNAIGDAQDVARQAGLTVDSDGRATGTDEKALDAYEKSLHGQLSKAKRARSWATSKLNDVTAQIVPSKGDPPKLNEADTLTLSEVLRGVYTLPAATAVAGKGKLANLQQAAKEAKRTHRKMRGGTAEWEKLLQERRALRGQIQSQRMSLSSVESWTKAFKGSRAAGLTFGDVTDELRGGKAGVLTGINAAGGILTGAMVFFQAKDDVEKGWSWPEALLKNGGAAAAGLAAGIGVEAAVAAAPVEVPVAVSVVGGVAVGYGVGTYAYELVHAGDWSDNIQEKGVVGGIGQSFADAGSAWVENDVKGLAEKAKNSVEGVWNGVFG